MTQDTTRLLRAALNAAFSTACGLAFVAAGHALAAPLGLPKAALWIFGAALLGFAASLLRAARRRPLPRGEAAVLIAADVAYVLASAVVLLGWPSLLSPGGRIFFAVAADLVAVFAVVEFVGLRRLADEPADVGPARSSAA